MIVNICDSSSSFTDQVKARIGYETLPKFLETIQDEGIAWCYYGVFNDVGNPVMKILQACRFDDGRYAIRDCSGRRETVDWKWINSCRKMMTPAKPDIEAFRTAGEIARG